MTFRIIWSFFYIIFFLKSHQWSGPRNFICCTPNLSPPSKVRVSDLNNTAGFATILWSLSCVFVNILFPECLLMIPFTNFNICVHFCDIRYCITNLNVAKLQFGNIGNIWQITIWMLQITNLYLNVCTSSVIWPSITVFHCRRFCHDSWDVWNKGQKPISWHAYVLLKLLHCYLVYKECFTCNWTYYMRHVII